MDAGTAHVISWSEPTKGHVPPPLTGPSITLSPLPAPAPPTVFLFGGKSVQSRRLTSEMWAMDLSTRTWERVDAGDGPGPRYFHSMDVWEDKLVCFGGMSDSDPMSVHNDIWLFDCRSRRWLPQPTSAAGDAAQDPALVPLARYAHLSAVSRGKLVISGGQHSDNSWIYEINVYDLRSRLWVSKAEQPQAGGMYSKGAYRSVATSSKKRVVLPQRGQPGEIKAATTHSYSVDEEGKGGDIWCYSNYDFAKVRRELDIISPDSHDDTPSPKHVSPPSFAIRDESARMRGSSQPPGLRFPTGGIVGNYFILCGLYLASVSGSFSIWALNLDTMSWKHLEPAVLATGSWNRAVVWPEKARVLVFGNTQFDLSADYSRRAVNLDHIAVISLEAFGIYPPPNLVVPPKVQQVGLSLLDEKLASDFEVVCDDGRRVKCSRRILSERWEWFAEQERELADKARGVVADAPAVDINDTLLGSFTPARLAPTSLTLSEPFPVCVALVQYFYTLSLATPLQNRAPVLSALLFMSKQYNIERLNRLVVHALHERLEASIAVGIYEIATLAGEQALQVRALNMIHSAKSSSSRGHRQGPSGSLAAAEADAASANRAAPGSAGAPGGPTGTSGAASGGNIPGGDAPYRRARADSFTIPDELTLPPSPEPAPPSPAPQGLTPSPTIGRPLTMHEEEEKMNALLAALDVSRDAAAAQRRESVPRAPGSISGSVGRRPSERSLASSQTGHVQGSPRGSPAPAVPQRHHMRLPPLAPPPLSRLPSFPTPQTPESQHPPHSHAHGTHGHHRPSSPTNSDVTSNYPQTPSETLRESWILPQHRDWSLGSGLGGGMGLGLGGGGFGGVGMMDSRSSSSSGLAGLPALPEDGSMPPRRPSRPSRDHLLDPYGGSQGGKKIAPSTLETAGLLPPPNMHSQSLQSLQGLQGLQGSRQSTASTAASIDSPSTSSHTPSYYFDSPVAPGHLPLHMQHPQHSAHGSVHRTPSIASAPAGSPNAAAKARHFSIATQSSGASAPVSSGTGSNPMSPTGTDWGEDAVPDLPGLMRSKTGMSVSTFDCGSSISSGSTGTSSKRAMKEEAKAIKLAEKSAKKAEAQAHFLALRAEQAKKMAISKAEAQRKADIAAAKEKEETDRRAAKQQAKEREKDKPKSKWGKLAAGVKDAVLFPEGGSNSTMF
ncbi:hypothetical protein IAT38_008049 [Cryptococcus sp. DSM 104549]